MLETRSSRRPARFFSRRAGAVLLGTLAMFVGSEATESANANGDTRSLTLYHTHRGDTTTITFKRDGRYDADGLRQLSYFLRDWRNNKQTRMEPRLFDIVWEVHRQVGRGGMINIVSAYRSPETNAYLHSHSAGVAKFSQHMLGRAMDFYITGVPVSAVREAGMRLQRGGVGFYPTSGRPFVHLDAGNIRAWPRMTRAQLVRLFPDGKTVHLPADGGPLPGYQVALAELKARGQVSTDEAYASAGSKPRGLFALLFGGGGEGDEEAETGGATAVAAASPARGGSSSSGDDEAAPPATKVATLRIPVPPARPADMARPAAAPAETVVAAATVPLPPVAPARPAGAPAAPAAEVVATASIPLPPVAPTLTASKSVPLPPTAPAASYAVASAEPAAVDGRELVWRTGAQPAGQNDKVKAASPAMDLASSIPSPRPRATPESAVAVLAALPTPAPAADSQPREIDPKTASAYQAEASSFPKLPDALLGKRSAPGEMTLAYAPQAVDLPSGAAAAPRAPIAPQTRVTASAPIDPNVRVLSPYSTPSAVYAAAVAPMRKRATLTAPDGMVTAHLDDAALRAAATPVPADRQGGMTHPDQIHVSSLMVAPSAALVGGFSADPTYGARSDRFAGSSVMLLRVQSFLPAGPYASASSAKESHG